MTQYVWCKNDECRIPAFRCILCRLDCYEMRGRTPEGEISQAFELLRNSGRFKESFVMKRKDSAEVIKSQLSFFERNGKEQTVETAEQKNGHNVFLLENGRIEPFSQMHTRLPPFTRRSIPSASSADWFGPKSRETWFLKARGHRERQCPSWSGKAESASFWIPGKSWNRSPLGLLTSTRWLEHCP